MVCEFDDPVFAELRRYDVVGVARPEAALASLPSDIEYLDCDSTLLDPVSEPFVTQAMA